MACDAAAHHTHTPSDTHTKTQKGATQRLNRKMVRNSRKEKGERRSLCGLWSPLICTGFFTVVVSTRQSPHKGNGGSSFAFFPFRPWFCVASSLSGHLTCLTIMTTHGATPTNRRREHSDAQRESVTLPLASIEPSASGVARSSGGGGGGRRRVRTVRDTRHDNA